MKMNKHYNELKASYLFVDIAHKVAAYQEAHPEKEIIRLGIGDVTQPLAKCVVKAMHDAADEMGTKEGFHGYGPEQGYPFLKQAIQGYYAGRGTQLAEDEIFISDGAKSDLANVLGLFDVDNTVLVPDPVYPTYVDDNVTDGRKIIYSRTSQENGFLGMPDENVKADIIYICSPNNPTGAAYTRDQLKAWVDYARKNDAIILYDAAYECFISDGEHAILLSSHIVSDIEKLCGRVAFLHKGRLILSEEKEALLAAHPGQTLEEIILDITRKERAL